MGRGGGEESGASWSNGPGVNAGWCPVCSVLPANAEQLAPRGLALRRPYPNAGRSLGPSDWCFGPGDHASHLFPSLVNLLRTAI